MARRTSIEIDEERLARAQAVLGTTGLKDTVDAAFDDVVQRARLDRLSARVGSGEGIDRSADLLDRSRPER